METRRKDSTPGGDRFNASGGRGNSGIIGGGARLEHWRDKSIVLSRGKQERTEAERGRHGVRERRIDGKRKKRGSKWWKDS